MALNAFWGHKEVIIVNEAGCQLAKQIVKELREANFNAAQEVSSFDYAGFADSKPDYILVVEEGAACKFTPYKVEGHVGDRLGHYVQRSFDEENSRFAYEDHFAAAGCDIRTNGSKQLDWERAKRFSWYYDDDNDTPILHLQAPNTHEVAKAVVESIKDYFRK